MPPIAHPGRLLKRELEARRLSANRLAQGLGVPSGLITDILKGRRGITADTAVCLGRYFRNRPQFWLDLQSQYEIAPGRDSTAALRSPNASARRCGLSDQLFSLPITADPSSGNALPAALSGAHHRAPALKRRAPAFERRIRLGT